MSDADIEVSVEEEEQQQETQGESESTQDEQPSTSQAAKGKKGSKRAAANRPGHGSVKAGAIAGTTQLQCQQHLIQYLCCFKCFRTSHWYTDDTITASADNHAGQQATMLHALSSPARLGSCCRACRCGHVCGRLVT